jgi:HEAT repeat protein
MRQSISRHLHLKKHSPSKKGFDESAFTFLADQCERIWDRHGKSAAQAFVKRRLSPELLRRALRHTNKLIRRKALLVITVLRPSDVVAELSAVLQTDSCPVLRHEAAFFLGTLKSRKVIRPLCAALRNDPDTLVKHEAAEALGDSGFDGGRAALEQAARSRNKAVKLTAQIALSQINGSA